MNEPYNEPAFPSGKIDVGQLWVDFPYLGMSLRDYFAARVLNMCSHDLVEPGAIAARAYAVADAMLKERSIVEGARSSGEASAGAGTVSGVRAGGGVAEPGGVRATADRERGAEREVADLRARLLALRDQVGKLPITLHPDYNCDFIDIDDVLMLVDDLLSDPARVEAQEPT